MNHKKILLPLVLSLIALASCGDKEPNKQSVSTPTISSSSSASSKEVFEEVLSNQNVVFPSDVINEIPVAKEGDSGDIAYAELKFDLVNANSCTEARITVETSDGSIIPATACKVDKVLGKNDNIIVGGKVKIDLTLVKLGSCYVRITFKGLNGNSPRGIVTKKIDVVPYGEAKTLNYEENVTLDFSNVTKNKDKLTDANIIAYSIDVPYGTDVYEQQSAFPVDTAKTKTVITFKAIPNILYSISIIKEDTVTNKRYAFKFTPNETITANYSMKVDSTSVLVTYKDKASVTLKVLDDVNEYKL